MARTTITATTLTATGYNVTDSSDYDTLSTGAGNGVSFAYSTNDTLVLKNDTGGDAIFTIKVPSPTNYSARVTIPDDTVTVVTAKEWLYKVTPIFKQTDGNIYIECDVAGKILVMRDPTT